MQTTFLGIQAEYADARAAILPAPFDGTTTYMPGARFGPRAILEASQELELYDRELECEAACEWGIHTLPVVPAWDDGKRMVEEVRVRIAAILADGKLPFMLGGDHSLTLGGVQAAAARYPDLVVVQLDAHADLRDEYRGNPLNHACVARRMLEIPGVRLLQGGVRSVCEEEIVFLRSADRVTTGFREDLFDPGWWSSQVESLAGVSVYLTIDVDVLDPSVMPATGTPEPGGLSWLEGVDLVRQLSRCAHIVAADCVELMPLPGIHHPDFAAAKLVYKTIALACSRA